MGWTPLPDNGIDAPKWKGHQPLRSKGASTMEIATAGIDLAKNVFQVHGVNAQANAVLGKQLRRDQWACSSPVFHPV